MAQYKITATTNDISHPFELSEGDGFGNITSINLNGCYAEIPSFSHHEKLTKLENGYITNTNCYDMFNSCTSLTSFTSDLSNVENGDYMFWNTPLESFESDLNNLTSGEYMFADCKSLTSFTSDLSNLQDGKNMFYGCPLETVKIKCSETNKSLMTKSNLSIRPEATLQVSTDGGTTWKTVTN